jgi:5'-nucleotidase (lipoprotein e(P4) family)
MRVKVAIALGVTIGLAACATAPYPDGLHWFRDSAESKAAYIEIYRAATESARKLSQGLAPETWGVILDIDETILNNSEYQRRLALGGHKYEDSTWDAWVHEAAAPALPGAKAFIDTVIDELHGRVALVTNRTQIQCDITEKNLRQLLIRYDLIACDDTNPQDPHHGDKNGRFNAIAMGQLIRPGKAELPPIQVLIFVGDNIQDFPHLSQSLPGDLANFGARYFVLPNPMYGSWQGLAAH